MPRSGQRIAKGAGRSRLKALLRLALLAAPLTSACSQAPFSDNLDGSVASVSRLDPAVFGLPTPKGIEHAAMVVIGDEARPALLAPPRVQLSERLNVAVEARDVVIDLEITAAGEKLRDRPLMLAVQEIPLARALPTDAMAGVAHQTFWHRPASGWSVQWPDAKARGPRHLVLRYQRPKAGAARLNITLDALGPIAQAFAATDLEFQDGSKLLFASGLAGQGRADAQARIRTNLTCDGDEAPRPLLDRMIRPHDGWVETTITPGACKRGILTMVADAPDKAAIDVAWAVPRVLTPVATDPPHGIENVILISLDTLRADHLSGYGYGRPTSPSIDRELIAQGTTFLDVTTTFPQTDISHLSLFTGVYPAAQPVRGRLAATDARRTLAEVLQKAGLATGAFTEDALVSGAFGFWYGFDTFVERSFEHDRRGSSTFADGIRFLESHRDERFFLFLHTYLTHDPYVAPPRYDALFRDEKGPDPAPWVPAKGRHHLDAYDRTIRAADDLVGELLAALEHTGLAKNTLVVLLSDHGESFGEHGIAGHGFAAHREQLWIPLILRGPGIPAGRRIDAPISIVDVLPTISGLMGIDFRNGQGVDLSKSIKDLKIRLDPERPIFFSWLRHEAAGVRRGKLKLMRSADQKLLYDAATDPYEWKPLIADARERAVAKELDQHLTESANAAKATRADSPGSRLDVDANTERSLRALGYIE